MKRYTKTDFEMIIMNQLENLNAMHDLLAIMKVQNEILHNLNKKFKDELYGLKKMQQQYLKGKKG